MSFERFLRLLKAKKSATLLVFLSIIAVYGLTFYKREAGYRFWETRPDEYVVENYAAMSTIDAYWWLKTAKDFDAGRTGGEQVDPLLQYPDGTGYPRPSLLVRLISLGKHFTGGDYYRAGLLLVPFLAGLFVFPLFFYFHRLGFGASAVLGGLVGSFSWTYCSRTSAGFVDTDLLNLFFPMGVSALVVAMNRERTLRANAMLALGAGATMYLFNWWYQLPLFVLVYLIFVAIYLFALRFRWKEAACLLAVFALASGPVYLLDSVGSLWRFLFGLLFPRPTGQIVWPNIVTTIQEMRTFHFATDLGDVYDFTPLVLAGLVGLFVLYIIRGKQMIPISPLVLIGLWTLFGPIRFAMYLAPFVGVGTGVLFELVARQVATRVKLPPVAATTAALLAMAAVFFPTVSDTAYHYEPAPAVPAATVKALLDIKRLVPKHSPMFTWWSRGYPLMEIGEFATYHDGATQGGIRTTLIAKAMTSRRQEDIASLISCIEEFGFERLKALAVEKNWTADQLMSLAFSRPASARRNNNYVLYMDNMIPAFDAISLSGTWDFNTQKSSPQQYTSLTYLSHSKDNFITCREGTIDLNKGSISDGTTVVPLSAALFIRDGYVADRVDYPAKEGAYLQVLVRKSQAPIVLVADEQVFRTNFNQQYLLGNYDRRYFEEVYNNFPVARVFRVRGAAEPEASPEPASKARTSALTGLPAPAGH